MVSRLRRVCRCRQDLSCTSTSGKWTSWTPRSTTGKICSKTSTHYLTPPSMTLRHTPSSPAAHCTSLKESPIFKVVLFWTFIYNMIGGPCTTRGVEPATPNNITSPFFLYILHTRVGCSPVVGRAFNKAPFYGPRRGSTPDSWRSGRGRGANCPLTDPLKRPMGCPLLRTHACCVCTAF